MADEWLERAAARVDQKRRDPAPAKEDAWLGSAAKRLKDKERNHLSTSLETAAGGNPAKIAEIRRNAKEVGLDPEIAQRNPQDLPRLRARKAAEELFGRDDTPATKRAFQDPSFADVAHDRTEPLGFLERNINALKRGTVNTFGVTGEYIGFKINQGLEALGEGLLPKPRGMTEAEWGWSRSKAQDATRTGGLMTMAKAAADIPRDPYQEELARRIDAEEGTLGAIWEGTKYLATHPSIFATLTSEQVPSLAAFGPIGGRAGAAAERFARPVIERTIVNQAVRKAIQKGAPLATVQFTTNSGMTFGAELSEGLTQGMTVPEAETRAITKAATEGGVNALSAFLPVPAGTTRAGRIGSQLLEAEKQGLFGAAGAYTAAEAVGEEASLSELFLEHWGEFATAPVDVAVATFSDPNARDRQLREATQLIGDAAKAQAARDSASNLETLGELAQNEELAKRDPEAFEAFVKQIADEESDTVYVEAAKFTEVMEQAGLNPQDVMDTLPSVREQYTEAQATGGDLRIPLGEYVTKIATTEYHQPLAQHVRTRQDGMSAAEAQTWQETAIAEFEQRASRVDPAEDEAAPEPARQIFERMREQLGAIEQDPEGRSGLFTRQGKISKKAVEGYARLHFEVAKTLASRGVDPMKYYGNLFVQGTEAPGAQFDQPTEPFYANISQRAPGVTDWEFTVPSRGDAAPVEGSLRKHPDGWHFVMDGQESAEAYSSRQKAAQSAWERLHGPWDQTLQQPPRDTTLGSIQVEEITDAEEQQRIIEEYRERIAGRPARESEVTGTTVAGKPARDGWAETTRVTRNGRPATVFRGGRRPVSLSSFEGLGANTGLSAGGLGVFFTASATEAQGYGPHVSEVFLDIRNPKVFTPKELGQLTEGGHLESVETAKAHAQTLREEGYDGIAIDSRQDGGTVHFIAFDPEQVITAGQTPTELFQSLDNVDTFADSLQRDLGLKTLNLYQDSEGGLTLGAIIVDKEDRRQGIGTRAMQRIAAYADHHGLRVKLTPAIRDDFQGTTSRSRLVKFYKRFGFVENKGRNKDYSISEGMYRDPQTAELYQAGETDTDSAAFKRWAGGADVPVIEGGRINEYDFTGEGPFVVKVWHGTTHEFNEFDATRGNFEGHFGAVNYFTSSEDDASQNYAGVGPDLTNRIEQRAEMLEDEIQESIDEIGIIETIEARGLTGLFASPTQMESLEAMDVARMVADSELSGGMDQTLELFVRMDRPFTVGGETQWLEFVDDEEVLNLAIEEVAGNNGEDAEFIRENQDDFQDEIDEARWDIEADSEHPLAEAIRTVADRYDVDTSDLASQVYDLGGEATSTSVEELMRGSEDIMYAESPDTGGLISSQLIGEVIQEMGYDAIILKNADKRFPGMNMGPGTAHIHIFHANRTNIKSVENVGTFNPADANIYAQGRKARGKIGFAPDITEGPTVISLLEGADLSTFLHESGHFFFEVWRDLASQPDADPSFQQDMQALLDYVGVDSLEQWNAMSLEERRDSHEKVARSFEAYLFEGKAPTPGLRKLFDTFAAWLRKTYRALKNLNVDLTDDVRQVFDRMVASEDQITMAERNQEMTPLFTTAEEAGMTEEEFAAYQALAAESHEDAVRQLETHSLRDMKWLSNAKNKTLKRLQKQADSLRNNLRAEALAELEATPVYRALRFFKTGHIEDSAGSAFTVKSGHRLAIAAVEALYSEALPASRPGPVDPTVDTLQVAIAKLGGLDQDEAEAQGLDPAYWKGAASRTENQPIFGKRTFRKEGGLSFDAMAEALSPHGYLPTPYTANDLLNLLDRALAGGDVYSVQVAPEIATAGRYEPIDPPDWRRLGYGAYGVLGKEGVDPDLAAEWFGFSSGDEMVRALLEAQPIDEAAGAIADQRMVEEHAELSDAQAIEAAANEALHNEARQRMVATELKAVSKMAQLRTIDRRQAREYAEAAVAKLKVRNSSPYPFVVAERRAGKAAQEAIVKGETLAAARAKQEEFLNGQLVREAQKAQSEVEKIVEYLKGLDTPAARKRIDPSYMDQIDQILARFDLRKGVTLKAIDKRTSLKDWAAKQEEMGLVPVIDERLMDEAQRTHYKDLTIADLRSLNDSIRNIAHLGKLKQKLLTARKDREFAEVVGDIEQSIRDNATRTVTADIESPSPVERVKEFFGDAFAAHRKISSYAREMDGFEDGGAVWEHFIRPMNERGDYEAVEREKATLRFSALFEQYQSFQESLKQSATRLSLGAFDAAKPAMMKKTYIPEIGRSLTKMARLSVALNWGNADNRARIMDKEGYGWSEEQVQAILNTLDKSDWDFVQGVWDFINEYWEQISEKERRVTGIAPQKVEAAPVQTPFGEYRGGYYPIKYDSRQSAKTEAHLAEDAAKQALRGAFTRSTTRRGHTKARTEGGGQKVRLDFGAAFEHVDQVIHDLAWHEWLIDANRLIGNKKIQAAIYDHYGAATYRNLKKAVDAIAAGDIPAENAFEKSINWIRTGTSIAGLGWSLWTSLLQPFGLSQSMVRIGPKWVGRGLAKWMGSAARMENTVADIYEISPFMRLRGKTMQREINEIQNKVMAGGVMSKVQDSFFYLIVKAQQVADVPTWLGQYEKAIAEGLTEEDAVRLADQAVLDSQGGGQIKDLAQIQRGSPLLKLWTNFYSYFNTTFNLTAESYRRNNLTKPREMGRFAVDMLLLYTLPATLSALMREATRGECAEGDNECLMEAVVRENLSYMSGSMVGMREFSGFLNGYYGYSGPAGTRFFSESMNLLGQAQQGEVDRALLRSLNNTAGILFHYPAAQVQRTADGFAALADGDTNSPLAPAFGPRRD